ILGGTMETAASFEVRNAPSSYPTKTAPIPSLMPVEQPSKASLPDPRPLREGVAMATASIAICREDRQRDFAISNVVVDPFGEEIFAGLIHFHRLDRSIFPQLADNIVALCICVRIRGMGDLK